MRLGGNDAEVRALPGTGNHRDGNRHDGSLPPSGGRPRLPGNVAGRRRSPGPRRERTAGLPDVRTALVPRRRPGAVGGSGQAPGWH